MRLGGRPARAGGVPRLAAAARAVRGDRRAPVLQRFGGDHTRIDRRRAAVAGRSDVALSGRQAEGVRFRAAAGEIARRGRGAAFLRGRRRIAGAWPPSTQRCLARRSKRWTRRLDWCWRRSRPGEAILLSPGSASTDQFQNFRRRGERFVELRSVSPIRSIVRVPPAASAAGDSGSRRRLTT